MSGCAPAGTSTVCWPERHVNLDAEDRIDDVDGFGAVKVAAAPLEPRILGGADDDKEIAGRRPRLLGGQAVAGDAQRRAVLDTWRNAHFERLLTADPSCPHAFRARRIDEGTAAAAIRTCRYLLQRHALLALASHKLPDAAALRAGPRFRALLRARAPASLADRGTSDMNRLLAAMENPLERRLEDNLEVLAPRPSGARPEKSVERPRRSLAECPARSGQGSSVPPRSAG